MNLRWARDVPLRNPSLTIQAGVTAMTLFLCTASGDPREQATDRVRESFPFGWNERGREDHLLYPR
jgi:hypothetical protein